MKKNIEIIAMVYKSIAYFEFIKWQLNEYAWADGWDVSIRIFANDPTPKLENWMKSHPHERIKYAIYNDFNINDYYLNRVYRCWNTAGMNSKADNICFVNSDMAFTPGWLPYLLKYHDGKRIPCSMLIESGKMPSGKHARSVNLGQTINQFDHYKWLEYSQAIWTDDKIAEGGLYMPCVFETKTFRKSGGYPWGNIYTTGAGTRTGQFVQSGDAFFFERLRKEFGLIHTTVLDSHCYHFQEGEMDD